MKPVLGDRLRTAGQRAESVLIDFVRDDGALLAGATAFGLVAYGHALVNPSLSLDEESTPLYAELGVHNPWSIALYRWGLVAFQYAVLPGSTLPFLRPLLAVLLLAVVATVYARMLPTTRAAQAFFALVFVTVPTFAYAMTFSFMCVEFVLALLLFVLGLRCLLVATARPAVERWPLAAALALWVVAPSFYQDYGVVLTAALVLAFFRLAAGETGGLGRQALWLAGVLLVSGLLYGLASLAFARAAGMSDVEYLTNQALLPERTRATPLHVLGALSHFYFSREIYGTRTLGLAAIALPLLGASVATTVPRRLCLVGLGLLIPLAPFAYGLGILPPIRAASGLLFVLAGACAFAVARSGPAIAPFVKGAVIWVALYDCVMVNNLFRYESLVADGDRMVATELAQRIHDVAPDVHVSPHVRVVFAGALAQARAGELPGADRELWVEMFHSWGRNIPVRRQQVMRLLGFPEFRLGTADDYESSRPLLEEMPAWPARGAVVRSGALVLVKLGPLNGYSAD